MQCAVGVFNITRVEAMRFYIKQYWSLRLIIPKQMIIPNLNAIGTKIVREKVPEDEERLEWVIRHFLVVSLPDAERKAALADPFRVVYPYSALRASSCTEAPLRASTSHFDTSDKQHDLLTNLDFSYIP